MLDALLFFWRETFEPWLNGPFSFGWVAPFGMLAWPAAVTYGVTFVLYWKKKEKNWGWVLPVLGILLFSTCRRLLWNGIGGMEREQILLLTTWSVGFVAGFFLYELPRNIWNRIQKRKRRK